MNIILFLVGITPMVILGIVAWNTLPAGAKWILPAFGLVAVLLGGLGMRSRAIAANGFWIILVLAIAAALVAASYL